MAGKSSKPPSELKVVLLGDPASGKTTLAKSWESGTRTTKNDFQSNIIYAPTCGIEFYKRRVSLGDSQHAATLTIWDVSGATLSRPKTLSTYIYNAKVILFLYSLDKTEESRETGLAGARRWIEAVTECWDRDGGKEKDVYMGLVGTKSDLVTGEAQVPEPGHADFCERWRVHPIPFVVSGKTGEGVNSMFTKIASDRSGVVYREDGNGAGGVFPATVHRSGRRRSSTASRADGEPVRQKDRTQRVPTLVAEGVDENTVLSGEVPGPVRVQNDGSQTCSVQ